MGLYAPSTQPATGSYAASVNGLTLGSGTDFRLVGMTGWYDHTSAPLGGNAQLSAKPTANGSWAMPYYVPSRVVTLLIAIEATVADGSFADAVSRLAQATQPQVDSYGQPVQIPVTIQVGDPNQQTVYGSVSSRQIPTLTPDFTSGVSFATIEVTCPDPRRFGADVSATTFLPTVSGGLTFPSTVPWVLSGTQVSGQVSITNPGNTSGPVKLRIYGPCPPPSVTHLESGYSLTLSTNLTILAGDWLDIDCEARTVLYNGQASRNGYLTSRGWFAFEPGPNTFSFGATNYNASAQLQVTCTPAWI